MKKIIFYFVLLCSFLFSNTLNLNNIDLIILKKISTFSTDKMTSYTLMALSIKESSVGKYLINDETNDYGLFQANIKTVLSRQGVKDTPANRKYYSTKLVNDVDFSVFHALMELKYWRKVHKNSWFKVWASYNTGWNYKSNIGLTYAESIFSIIKKLKYEYNL